MGGWRNVQVAVRAGPSSRRIFHARKLLRLGARRPGGGEEEGARRKGEVGQMELKRNARGGRDARNSRGPAAG